MLINAATVVMIAIQMQLVGQIPRETSHAPVSQVSLEMAASVMVWFILCKLIMEVYYDLKYNHFLNRAFSYFSPLLSCVDHLTQNNNNAWCNDQAQVVSSSGHSRNTFVYISRSGIYVLPTEVSTYCMQTWREFDRICLEKTIAAFLPVFTRAERTWAFAKTNYLTQYHNIDNTM